MTHNQRGDWRRVSRAERCPVCERPDWCLVTGPEGDPTAAICARAESDKRAGEAGWVHVLRREDDWQRQPRRRTARPVSADPPPNGSLAAEAEAAIQWCEEYPEDFKRFAFNLGVSTESLQRLCVGYSPARRAWLFPMKDSRAFITGVRLRLAGGRKFSIRGGKESLFFPNGLALHRPLLIAEGPTDTAALLDMGFAAVGRPSCNGGVKHLVRLVSRVEPSEVIVVADRDGPGLYGAKNLAARLLGYVPEVRVITPPCGIKDARAWRQTGATPVDVQAVIDAAPVRRLQVIVKGR